MAWGAVITGAVQLASTGASLAVASSDKGQPQPQGAQPQQAPASEQPPDAMLALFEQSQRSVG